MSAPPPSPLAGLLGAEPHAEAEALLRKHAAMYDWSKSEAKAIEDFILTVRFGMQEDLDAARAAVEQRVAALTEERDALWGAIHRVVEIIGAEEQTHLDLETAVQMYVDWANEKIAALEADAALGKALSKAAERVLLYYDDGNLAPQGSAAIADLRRACRAALPSGTSVPEAERGTGPDWTCERCRAVNFDLRVRCRLCKAERPAVAHREAETLCECGEPQADVVHMIGSASLLTHKFRAAALREADR